MDRVLPWPGDRPWNFVLHDGARRRADLHLYEALPDGSLHYGSVVDGAVFPAGPSPAGGGSGGYRGPVRRAGVGRALTQRSTRGRPHPEATRDGDDEE